MTDDAIIREIRATREAFAAAHGYDIQAMGDTLRRLTAESGREVTTLPPRPVTLIPAPSSPAKPTEAA
jgi:hypothetical protein